MVSKLLKTRNRKYVFFDSKSLSDIASRQQLNQGDLRRSSGIPSERRGGDAESPHHAIS